MHLKIYGIFLIKMNKTLSSLPLTPNATYIFNKDEQNLVIVTTYS